MNEVKMGLLHTSCSGGSELSWARGVPASAKCIDLDKAIGKITCGGVRGDSETYSLRMGSFTEKPWARM
jgi:hypothetical protein